MCPPRPEQWGSGQCLMPWTEDQRVSMGVLEVEHAVDRTGDAVQRSAADARQRPVVLDETEDRGLVGEAVVDEVLPRGRGHEQRQTRTVAAAVLITVDGRGIAAPAGAPERALTGLRGD
jgi:hypothetical protein